MIAPFVLDGPINRLAFETYVERVLTPELRQGDVVVMDNLSSHKGQKVRERIEAAGASLFYLPPYSPDFNPIEKRLRQAQSPAAQSRRANRPRLWIAIGQIVDLFVSDECRNYFAAAGYDATRSAIALACL